jgi:predicted transcriptional regulator
MAILKKLNLTSIKVILFMRLSDLSLLVVQAELMINALISLKLVVKKLKFNFQITTKGLKLLEIFKDMIVLIKTVQHSLLLLLLTHNSHPRKD